MSDSKQRNFKDWFQNVFWYHYKWWFLAAVFVVALVVLITVESARTTKYDLTVVVGQYSGDVTQASMEGVLEVVGQAAGDLNGDGEVNINYLSVNLGDSSTDKSSTVSASESNQTRMLLYLASEEYMLFLLDKDASDVYTSMDFFEDELANYGIPSDEENPYRVYLGDSPVFREAGLELYGHIIDWTTIGKGSQQALDGSVAALKAFLSE